MSAYLGPETPRPFSVISESYRNKLNIPFIPEYERYTFGEAYEHKMCELVHRYLDLGTDDRLCYVGDSKGTLAYMLQRVFCLIEPVTTVVPGHMHYEETPTNKLLPIRIANVGAEEYFRRESRERPAIKPPLFDKILLKDAVQFFEYPKETFKSAMDTMSENGKMLIIYRPGTMNTLPLTSDIKTRLSENETSYMDIIKTLQSCGFDVQWEIECLPIIMSKLKWLAMLNEKFPPQMAGVSATEVRMGLRTLSEGVMKYEGEMVEFMDRLLFITATRTLPESAGLPNIQRLGAAGSDTKAPVATDIKYQMDVKGDLEKYVQAKLKKMRDAERRKSNKLW